MWGGRWRRSKEGKVSGSEEGRDKGGYRYRVGIRRKGEKQGGWGGIKERKS